MPTSLAAGVGHLWGEEGKKVKFKRKRGKLRGRFEFLECSNMFELWKEATCRPKKSGDMSPALQVASRQRNRSSEAGMPVLHL